MLGVLFCFSQLPHRKVTFCVTSLGDGLNRQINLNAVFNLNYFLSLLRRPHLHMKSFPNIFQKLNSCKLKIQPYTWQKDMSAQHKHTFCFCFFSSAKADEIASVILVLTLKETINQIIPNMNRKQHNWIEMNRYAKEQPWLFFKEEMAKKQRERWLKVLDEDTFSYAN